MQGEIDDLLGRHWHIVDQDSGCFGPARVTIEECHDPCARSDSHFLLLPGVGPLGVEIRARLSESPTARFRHSTGW